MAIIHYPASSIRIDEAREVNNDGSEISEIDSHWVTRQRTIRGF